MVDLQIIVELVMRGIAIGALAANGFAFVVGGASKSMRIAGALFFLSITGYVLNSSSVIRPAIGEFGAVVTLLSLGGGGFFWLFTITLFQDRQVSPTTLAPAAILTGLGLLGIFADDPFRQPIWIVHNLLEVGLSVHTLLVIQQSWRDDLVEARRRLRGPYLGVVALYTIAMSGVEIGESFGVSASWYSLAGAILLAGFCVAGCITFLRIDQSIFGVAQAESVAQGAGADPLDRVAIERLTSIMKAGTAWRDENLTIGALAEQVGVPEHRLRRLINDQLGFRNFAAFVNLHRIEAAKAVLADPAEGRRTVAAIAFDLGFGSLGPFNRTFREATGKTPTQWRRDALSEGLPKSENPR